MKYSQIHTYRRQLCYCAHKRVSTCVSLFVNFAKYIGAYIKQISCTCRHKRSVDKVHCLYSHSIFVYGHMHSFQALQRIRCLCRSMRRHKKSRWYNKCGNIFFFKKKNSHISKTHNYYIFSISGKTKFGTAEIQFWVNGNPR